MQKNMEELEKKHEGGSGWFGVIAVLSLINIILIMLNTGFLFPVGLGISTFAAAMFNFVPEPPDPEAVMVAKVIGVIFLFFSLVVIGIFFLCKSQARKGKNWAYVLGFSIYAADALICLLFRDWISLAFHAWGLFAIWGGFSALRELKSMPYIQQPVMMEAEVAEIPNEFYDNQP